ncbi:MAG: SurA N-terminal domain-containing protein [Janthinobacterium lividum]
MITLFRNFAKSKWAVGLFALIILSFVVVGAQSDIFAKLGARHVISAGERSVDQQRFRADFERVRANISEQAGRPVSFEELVEQGYLGQFLESQTQRLGFSAWAWKAGIRPGKELVLKRIREVPAFFNSITGQFDQELYVQALSQQSITPEMLEQDLRDEFAAAHYGAGLAAGVRLPAVYSALLAAQAMETRDGAWFTVTQAMAGSAGQPTDEQLNAFIKEMDAQLRRPEFRKVSLVLFTPGPNDARPAVTEEQLRERFEFRKDSLTQPETRSFTVLSAPSKEVADKIAAELRAGKPVAEVAAANRIQPTPYNNTPRTALGDPAIADAVFGLQAAGTTAAIQARVGFAVAQVTAINAGRDVTFEEARPALVQELQAEAAKTVAYDRVKKFEDARAEGKSIADAVAASGARLTQLPAFTQQGQLENGQPMQAPPAIIETAYALSKGGESDVINAADGQYFALRVDDVIPSALPPLDEFRAPLTQAWVQRENARLLSAKAEELAGRVRAGEDITAVAASVNASVTVRTNVAADQASQNANGAAVLRGLFGQGKDQVFTGNSETGFIVGRVNAIHAADPAKAAPLIAQLAPRMSAEWVDGISQHAITAAAARVKAKNSEQDARTAIGVTAPAAGAPAPAPAPAQ